MSYISDNMEKLWNIRIVSSDCDDWVVLLKQELSYLDGIPEGSRISCILPRCARWVACLVSCWMKGLTFVPIDSSHSQERTDLLISLSQSHYIRDNDGYKKTSVEYDDKTLDLAWMCFTSGSTGLPKGVMVPFNGVENLFTCQISAFNITSDSRVLWNMSPGFDASFSDVGVAIFSGATLYPTPDGIINNPEKLIEFINTNNITHADIIPTLSKYLTTQTLPESLECLIFGGEVAMPENIRMLTKNVKVVNVYGPTEATVCTSMIQCNGDWSEPLIGYPLINGVEYSDVDNELLIGGACLARGYFNNDEETRKRFVTIDGTRWYKTGDKVSWSFSDNCYKFLGRIDREFKKAGVRISPEELEFALKQVEGVSDARILLSGKSIMAFIEGNGTYARERARLFHKTARPNQWYIMDKWKRLPSGKADVKWLLEHVKNNHEDGLLLDIIEEITGNRPSWEDGFITTGGDSLSLMTLICACEENGILIDRNAIANDEPLYNCIMETKNEKSFINLISYMDRKVGLTGVTGFLGIHLLHELLTINKKVTVFSRGDSINKIRNANSFYQLPALDFSRIDIINTDLTQDDQPEVNLDILFHCAADISLGNSEKHALDNAKQISSSVLKIAGKARIVHISTLSLFVSGPEGKNPLAPVCELGPWTGCYAQSKALSELYIQDKRPDTVIIRPSLLTGTMKGIIPKHDLFQIAVNTCLGEGSFPFMYQLAELNAVRVDQAAKAINILSYSEPGIKLIAAPENTTLTDLSRLSGIPTIVSGWNPKNGLGKLAFTRVLRNTEYMKVYDLFLATKRTFKDEKTDCILKNNGVDIMTSNDAIIPTLQNIKQNFKS